MSEAEFTQKCPECGRWMPDDINYCGHCGKELQPNEWSTRTVGGDSAFPKTERVQFEDKETHVGGLTKREYFAASAMQGIFANGEPPANERELGYAIVNAVKIADMLIHALNTVEEPKK